MVVCVIVGDKNSPCWSVSKGAVCDDKGLSGRCFVLREGKEQRENNKSEVCGRGCESGPRVKALTRPNCQVKKQEAERWTLLTIGFFI